MRKWIIGILILICMVNIISASQGAYTYYSFDGDGEPHYPNSGYIYSRVHLESTTAASYNYDSYYAGRYITNGNNVNYTITGRAKITEIEYPSFGETDINYCWLVHHCDDVTYQYDVGSSSNTVYISNTLNDAYLDFDLYITSNINIKDYAIIYVTVNNTTNTISGTFSCVTNGSTVSIYGYINSSYQYIDTSENTPYSFSIMKNMKYKLIFSDGHEYEFTCDGSDVHYDYDTCSCIYGYTCNINWVKLWRDNAGSWEYVDMESQPNHGLNIYVMQIESGYDYKINFSDGHEHEFTCSGSDIEYDWDRCVWVDPPSSWEEPEIIPWYLGYDNNIVFMRDSHGNFIENAQIAVYNKNTDNYTQKWTNTPDPYILLAANNDSDDDVIVMCRTFDGIFTLETVDPAFGTDENVSWTNWTIPIMYNLAIHPTDQSNMPLHHVFVSMYEYAPFDPLAFFGSDVYWGYIPVTNCSGFSRCDIMAEKEGYQDYSITGLNWTTKSALIKDYKHNIAMAKES